MDTHLYSTVYLNMLLNVCVGHLEHLKKEGNRLDLYYPRGFFISKKKRKKEEEVVRYLIPSGGLPPLEVVLRVPDPIGHASRHMSQGGKGETTVRLHPTTSCDLLRSPDARCEWR